MSTVRPQKACVSHLLEVRGRCDGNKSYFGFQQVLISGSVLQLLSPLQVARCLVQSYPWFPDTLALTTWLAAEAGDPQALAFFGPAGRSTFGLMPAAPTLQLSVSPRAGSGPQPGASMHLYLSTCKACGPYLSCALSASAMGARTLRGKLSSCSEALLVLQGTARRGIRRRKRLP